MKRISAYYTLLEQEVARGFSRIVLIRDNLLRIFCIRLLRKDQSGIEIRNKMVDLAERVEIGQIKFAFIDNMEPSDFIIDIPECLFEDCVLSLLLVYFGDYKLVSGLKIVTTSGEEHIIVAGAAPYTLTLLSPVYKETHASEYDTHDYHEAPITSDLCLFLNE